MCTNIAKSLAAILTNDYLKEDKSEGEKKKVRSTSDLVNMATVTNQLFYAIVLDFMMAYHDIGFHAKMNFDTVMDVLNKNELGVADETETLIDEESVHRYLQEFCKPNTDHNKIIAVGKVMLRELLRPRFDGTIPAPKRRQMKVITANIGGNTIKSKWMGPDSCYPAIIEIMLFLMARKLHDEANELETEKKNKDALPFGNRKFSHKDKKLMIEVDGEMEYVTTLEQLQPETNIDEDHNGYITLTDMVRKAFFDPAIEESGKGKLDVHSVFDYILPLRLTTTVTTEPTATDTTDDEENVANTTTTEPTKTDYHQLFLDDKEMKEKMIADLETHLSKHDDATPIGDVKEELRQDVNNWYVKWSNEHRNYAEKKKRQRDENEDETTEEEKPRKKKKTN